MIIKNKNKNIAIEQAANSLLNGQILAVPTETVYGLAANMNNQNAVNKIYSIKNRPLNHPLIVHLANKNDLQNYCTDIPSYATELITHLWPGPITFIFRKSTEIPYYITGGQSTVAIRIPSHELTLKLINKLGIPIVAPSANKFKGVSPTRPEHVIDEFGEMIDVLDGGECDNGIESTIIDATQKSYYRILRPGVITPEKISQILKKNYSQINCINNNLNYGNSELSFPGNYPKHYSPKKSLFVFKNEKQFQDLFDRFNTLYVIYYSANFLDKQFYSYKMNNEPEKYAKYLYHALRLGDNSNCDAIALEAPPNNSEIWLAIWDRLNKSSSQE